jgi:hypothetical protein
VRYIEPDGSHTVIEPVGCEFPACACIEPCAVVLAETPAQLLARVNLTPREVWPEEES